MGLLKSTWISLHGVEKFLLLWRTAKICAVSDFPDDCMVMDGKFSEQLVKKKFEFGFVGKCLAALLKGNA